MGNNTVGSQRTKHIDIRYHYVKEQVEAGNITLQYVPTEEMVADALTKPVGRLTSDRCKHIMLGQGPTWKTIKVTSLREGVESSNLTHLDSHKIVKGSLNQYGPVHTCGPGPIPLTCRHEDEHMMLKFEGAHVMQNRDTLIARNNKESEEEVATRREYQSDIHEVHPRHKVTVTPRQVDRGQTPTDSEHPTERGPRSMPYGPELWTGP
jgi:hypothetical protein